MEHLTPPQIVAELDRYIVGQAEAKRTVAIALRNRHRRRQLPPELQADVTPKNILMIGATGIGKTEIARRIARLIDAPFVKVEATKFTEVGYVGRDVESIIQDLVENSVAMLHTERLAAVRTEAERLANDRLLTYLAQQSEHRAARALRQTSQAMAAQREGAAEAGDVPGGGRPLATDSPGATLERRLSRQRRHLARLVDGRTFDDEQIEIEIEGDGEWSGPSVLEFNGSMSPDELQEHIQAFVETLDATPRRRRRRVSVREARQILAQEEASRLVDLDSVVQAAVERAEQGGIVFVDELDKIVGSGSDHGPDVSGEGVQRDLLPIIEGSTVMTRFGPVKSDHVLFVAAGAFEQSKPSDLIPELQGRFPLRVELDRLTEEDLYTILVQPQNALTKQYIALLATESVALEFAEDGLRAMARHAARVNERTEDIGARRLHTIIEKVLEEISFAAAEHAGQTLTIDAAYVDARLGPIVADDDLSSFIL